jgi:hypothetical protein
MAGTVTDEMWAQLDPSAGQLSRRTVRRLRLGALIVLVILAAGLVTWRSGVVVPRLTQPERGANLSGGTDEDGVVEVRLRNSGWSTVTVTGAGRSGPGLDLVTATGNRERFPITLEPGEDFDLVLIYRVTACDFQPAGPWPIPVTVERPWGSQTVHIVLPPDSLTGGGMEEWQRIIAYYHCRRG